MDGAETLRDSTCLVFLRRKMSCLFLTDQTPLLLTVYLHTDLHTKDQLIVSEQTHKCRHVIYRWILFIPFYIV